MNYQEFVFAYVHFSFNNGESVTAKGLSDSYKDYLVSPEHFFFISKYKFIPNGE